MGGEKREEGVKEKGEKMEGGKREERRREERAMDKAEEGEVNTPEGRRPIRRGVWGRRAALCPVPPPPPPTLLSSVSHQAPGTALRSHQQRWRSGSSGLPERLAELERGGHSHRPGGPASEEPPLCAQLEGWFPLHCHPSRGRGVGGWLFSSSKLKKPRSQVSKAGEAPGHTAGEPGQGKSLPGSEASLNLHSAPFVRGQASRARWRSRPGQMGSHLFPLNCLLGQLQAMCPRLPAQAPEVSWLEADPPGPWLCATCMNNGWETPHIQQEPLWNTERHWRRG